MHLKQIEPSRNRPLCEMLAWRLPNSAYLGSSFKAPSQYLILHKSFKKYSFKVLSLLSLPLIVYKKKLNHKRLKAFSVLNVGYWGSVNIYLNEKIKPALQLLI